MSDTPFSLPLRVDVHIPHGSADATYQLVSDAHYHDVVMVFQNRDNDPDVDLAAAEYTARAVNTFDEALEALRGVIRVADRNTAEFEAARVVLARMEGTMRPPTVFNYSKWRHGGWYVHNVRYPNGAVGCVSCNYADRKWRIACDKRPFDDQPTFKTRDEAALAEWHIANATKED